MLMLMLMRLVLLRKLLLKKLLLKMLLELEMSWYRDGVMHPSQIHSLQESVAIRMVGNLFHALGHLLLIDLCTRKHLRVGRV